MAKVKIVHTTEYTYRSPVGLHAVCATGLYSLLQIFAAQHGFRKPFRSVELLT